MSELTHGHAANPTFDELMANNGNQAGHNNNDTGIELPEESLVPALPVLPQPLPNQPPQYDPQQQQPNYPQEQQPNYQHQDQPNYQHQEQPNYQQQEHEQEGIQQEGVQQEGVQQEGIQQEGIQQEGIQQERGQQEGIQQEGDQQDADQQSMIQKLLDQRMKQEPHQTPAKLSAGSRLIKTSKSTLNFKTDLPKMGRDPHPCGVLHFTRVSGGAAATEEHAFAWIARIYNEDHLNGTFEHLAKYGFDTSSVSFIPYSSRQSWVKKYPLAFPHVHCGDDGRVVGFPFWSEGGDRGVSLAVAGAAAPVVPESALAPAESPAKGGRREKKIFPTAHLPNAERDELHIEIYKYFKWLQGNLEALEGGAAVDQDGKRQRAIYGTGGVEAVALRNLTEGMEVAFRVVRSAGPGVISGQANEGGAAPSLPFLEEGLGETLGRLVEAVKRDPARRRQRSTRAGGKDFDEMFGRLEKFHQEHGHVNVPQKYGPDGQLGSWVANMRSKRKAMAKRGEEFELDLPAGVEEDDNDDEDNDGDEEDGEKEGEVEGDAGVKMEEEGDADGDGENDEGGRKKRKVVRGGRQRLTRERINRMDALGFQWVVANPNTKTWEERFEDLKEYQQLHGTTRVPRSSGTLGEWVHMQRRLWNKKDKNFLVKKAPLLDGIGFEWQPRKHQLISWEENFSRLVEFGRINRHYNVQSPFGDGDWVGDYDSADPELVEAHRFHKWVKRIHAEYRTYASGKGSRMLNESRVMQLREIGFHFV